MRLLDYGGSRIRNGSNLIFRTAPQRTFSSEFKRLNILKRLAAVDNSKDLFAINYLTAMPLRQPSTS